MKARLVDRKNLKVVLLLGDLMASATWLANPSLLTDGTRGFWAYIFKKMVIVIHICHLLK